ncbi:MAG: CocE/NonD family hydrolase [Gemmatimonadota bacterium]|jgi:putative CocE/NonD family hydrolase
MTSLRSAGCVALAVLVTLGGCADAERMDGDRISRPGEYEGYSEPVYDGYEMSSFYVEVRDGTRLAVDLFRPTLDGVVTEEPLPVVWMHTPYNRRTYRGGLAAERYPGFALRLVPYGYNVAVVDFRGLFASFGRNVGYNRGEWVDPARWDSYDVTEWFAEQPWSTGAVGMWGCSATGGSQMQTLTTRPPSLRAVVPMSAEFDAYPFSVMGGVARLERFSDPPSTSRQANAARDARAVPVDGPEAEALLEAAIAEHVDNIESVGQVPFRNSVSPTAGVPWWELSSPSTYLDELAEPGIGVLSVANWDEAGTGHGPFFTFNNVDPDYGKLLVGPATHCAWSAVRDETGFDLVTEELRFFDYWLKDVENGVMDEPAVTCFTYNAPEGSEWRTSEVWPLASETRTPYYLAGDRLVTEAPSDPSRQPAPIGVASAESTPVTFEVGTDGVSYETEPLPQAMEVTGHPSMDLWIETGAGDVDVTALLEDVAPDGSTRSYQMIGRLRASHRALGRPPYDDLDLPWRSHTEESVAPVPDGEPVRLEFEILPMSYVFPAGHRVRLTLTFADPLARGRDDLGVAVLAGAETPSAVILPVIPTR